MYDDLVFDNYIEHMRDYLNELLQSDGKRDAFVLFKPASVAAMNFNN